MQKSGNPLTDSRNLIILFTFIIHIAIDRLTKAWIRMYPPGDVIWQAGFLRVTHAQNTGAAFGLFQNQNTILAIVASIGIVVMLVLGFWLYRRFPYLVTKWNQIAFSLLLGGTTGNLIDRLTIGMVTDFLDVRFWPTFNAADSGVTIGGIMIAITLVRMAWKEKS